jgi:pimeloyl-ACP methyl ester carboxylesterase
VSAETIPVFAHDGGQSQGVLYRRGGEQTVVCFMHPRGNQTRHYAMPALLDAGFATFGLQGRWPNNDIGCIHEVLLADIAAAMVYIRQVAGFQKVVLCGNSGGGSLWTFYQAQASTPPPDRLTETAAGDPYDLNAVEMPPADGLVNLAVHLGEGVFLMNKIDPSVTVETDPLSCDPSLDMYDARNGFCEPPRPSSYSEEFLGRYRAAQVARVARLDAIARQYIDEQSYYQGLMDDDGFATLPPSERTFIMRRAKLGLYMIIYRTEADPAYLDLSLHTAHSTRTVGSLAGPRPDYHNYIEGGFARVMTPRGWLSTWSGLSSRASLVDNIGRVKVPTLIVHFTGDNGCFGDEAESIYRHSAALDKDFVCVAGDHYGLPIESRTEAIGAVTSWLAKRFPVRTL